jgi:hypothetical protein
VFGKKLPISFSGCASSSPWLLGFATHMTARSNAVAVGIVVAALASWAMVVDGVVRKWMDYWIHEHHLTR